MNTVKLKNIIIAILALLNLLLVTLLFTTHLQQREAYDRSLTQLQQLYASSGVTLDAALLSQEVTLAIPQPVRDVSAEQRFSEALLNSVSSVDSGGGIYRYYDASDSLGSECLFRANGTLEASLHRATDAPAEFCRTLCDEFGYTEYLDLLQDVGGTMVATRTFDNASVYNCTLTFSFDGSALTAVNGTFLPNIPLGEERMSPDLITALTRFLDYRNSAGLIYTEITAIQCGYLFQPTASAPLQLVPVGRISTNVNDYYVNLLTYEVTRSDTAALMGPDLA